VDKDQIAQQFAQALQKAQAQMVEDILDLKQSLTRDEFISLISTLDVDDYVFNKIGMQNDLNEYIASYENVLLGMEPTGQVTEETLQALVRLDEATFRKQISSMGEQVIDEAVKGIIGGKTEREIAQSMLGNVLRPDQAETLANTALNTFERNVTAEMAVNDPPNATYVYQGPVDQKTRDICLKMMSSGSLTRDQIDSRYPGAFVDGGGFNCRHRWAKETSVSKELTNPKEAKDFIEDKGGFKRTPLTPQQQLEQRG
jgi:hypothetical protein